jgi:polyisoprenoid-binding protein YceI
MKKVTLSLMCLALATFARGEVFDIDTGHAEIGFSVKHMLVSNAKGTFKTFTGSVDYDTASSTLVSATCTIDVASIDTNNEKRDAHLKNEDFFNVEKFPKMTFNSTAVKKTGDGTFDVTGNLNVLGKDHAVTIPVQINGPIDDPWGMKRLGFESTTELNRRDLGITHSKPAAIGDTVKIEINVEATYKK